MRAASWRVGLVLVPIQMLVAIKKDRLGGPVGVERDGECGVGGEGDRGRECVFVEAEAARRRGARGNGVRGHGRGVAGGGSVM